MSIASATIKVDFLSREQADAFLEAVGEQTMEDLADDIQDRLETSLEAVARHLREVYEQSRHGIAAIDNDGIVLKVTVE